MRLFDSPDARAEPVAGQETSVLRAEAFLGGLNDHEAQNAPGRFFVAGDVSLLQHGRRVAVVGSRDADAESLDRTRRFVKHLVDHCVTVVSGLALGVDTMAHQTAMEEGGRTIAVLGTPLDRTYPRQNTAMQERIIREHVAVSQFAPGSPVRRQNFALRNRTMALITDATVVVTAGPESGTRHQGWEAIRLGRDLFFLEPFVESSIPWVQEQVAYGAQPLGPDNLDLFFEHLPERAGLEPVAF